ncbi:unnamed protein product [Anisakis simplex]|uniref:Glyco_transf_64 domain-containing protein n=1 Tax=Anisakis simplex TaxID=6269 RepID=A0A0M3JHP0_ANISI|nr:unnamed protein product [Anisakis simplex]
MVWRENPERLVGFMHKNGFSFNETLASYVFIGKNVRAEGGEQQKVNIKKNMNRSMALGDGDGAVFYHKYYGILYGKELWRKWGRFGESAVPQQHFGQTATGISPNSLGGKCPLAVSDRKTVVYSCWF